MRKPGVSHGTRNMVVPCRSGAFGSVRASMKNSLPTLALAMKHFSPLRIHSSPWRSALSLRPASGWSGGSRLSEPALGSLIPLPSRKVSSSRNGLRNRRFCSSLQAAAIRWLHFQHWLKVFEMALSALASSAMTSAWVTKSVPWPPHSLGTAMVRKPSLEPFLMMSQSKVARGSSISSRSSEIGRISSSANLRAVICQARCSLLRVKSMTPALSSFRGENGGGSRRPAIARQRLGDAQLCLARPRAGVEADAGIVHVFLQRHIAHHAHGAETFRRVLDGAVDRLRREYAGDGGERQIGEAALGDGVRMVRCPRRLPNGGARNLEPHRDLAELCSDRLMLDDATAALHAQLRIVERGLVGGAADPEIERGRLRDAAARLVEKRGVRGETILGRHAAILEHQRAAGAVLPARVRLPWRHGQAGRMARHEQRADDVVPKARPHHEQRRLRSADDAVLAATDDPGIARAHRGGGKARLVRLRPVIVDAECSVALPLVLGKREVMAVVGEERGQEARTLLLRHQAIEPHM